MKKIKAKEKKEGEQDLRKGEEGGATRTTKLRTVLRSTELRSTNPLLVPPRKQVAVHKTKKQHARIRVLFVRSSSSFFPSSLPSSFSLPHLSEQFRPYPTCFTRNCRSAVGDVDNLLILGRRNRNRCTGSLILLLLVNSSSFVVLVLQRQQRAFAVILLSERNETQLLSVAQVFLIAMDYWWRHYYGYYFKKKRTHVTLAIFCHRKLLQRMIYCYRLQQKKLCSCLSERNDSCHQTLTESFCRHRPSCFLL